MHADWFHYTPRWFSPPMLVILGLSFVVSCNLATRPSLQTTLLAGTPVAVAWWLSFYVIPQQFKQFAQRVSN
jgi:hypothetical protein